MVLPFVRFEGSGPDFLLDTVLDRINGALRTLRGLFCARFDLFTQGLGFVRIVAIRDP